ncbi:conserved hypothetical protein [Methylocella tundrae]|uniref:SGNH hydrolase-type esterase domain-containing protein n=1 Tax=Methylocella tundrae TaxID=227605 RepID=A0A8B6M8N6_METTU|nr:SGNH/GDSL hydrolase family protein [Methylocella tundrae]VTZ26118.1 conserved hypothetical protein [Methylocella tundrae]VTZ51393.1 conserved hypothetical protein [Methylocella tundrae]
MMDRRSLLSGSALTWLIDRLSPFSSGAVAAATAPSLPALPLPAGAKLLGLGHHAIQIGDFAGGPNVACSINSYSPLIWSRFLDQRVNLHSFYDPNDPWGRTAGSILTMSPGPGFNGANQGVEADILCPAPLPNVPATNTPGILARAPYALARDPDVIFIQAGDNDIQGGRSAAAIIADLDHLLTQIRNAGVWVILCTLLPVWPSWTDAQHAIHDQVNTWILAQNEREGVKIGDMRSVWPNHLSLLARTINQTGQTYYDALNYPAASRAANSVIVPLLGAMVKAAAVDSSNPAAGNLIPNYAFKGATGSKGVGVTGQVATGWALNRISGASAAIASLEASGAAGLNKQVITVDATDTGNSNQFFRFSFATLNFSTVGVVDGDWVQQFVPIEVDSWTGWTTISPKIDMQGARRFIANHAVTLVYSGSSTWNAPVYVGAGALLLASEPTQVLPGAGLTSFRTTEFMDIYFDGTKGGSGKLKIGNPILRKVSDPRPAWNL